MCARWTLVVRLASERALVPHAEAKQIFARPRRSRHYLRRLVADVPGDVDTERVEAENIQGKRFRVEDVLVKVKRVHVVGRKRVLFRFLDVGEEAATLRRSQSAARKRAAELGIVLFERSARDVGLVSGSIYGNHLRARAKKRPHLRLSREQRHS